MILAREIIARAGSAPGHAGRKGNPKKLEVRKEGGGSEKTFLENVSRKERRKGRVEYTTGRIQRAPQGESAGRRSR